jgi:hypothetical protein
MVHFSSFPITAITRRTIIKDVAIEGTPPAPTPPCASFILSEQSQEEDAGPMIVTFKISAPTSKAVIVPYTIGGTATLGEDYIIPDSPVIFGPGETSVDIEINVSADNMYELDETVELSMGTPTHAIKCAPDVHTATILNDDLPPIVFLLCLDRSFKILTAQLK